MATSLDAVGTALVEAGWGIVAEDNFLPMAAWPALGTRWKVVAVHRFLPSGASLSASWLAVEAR